MAVLGSGGRLELRREAPSPCVILPEDLNTDGSLEIGCEGYWPGDKITISDPDGLPIFIDGKPQKWDGVASYFGSSLYVADNRDQITADNDQFYKTASEEYPAGEAGNDDPTDYSETTWFTTEVTAVLVTAQSPPLRVTYVLTRSEGASSTAPDVRG